ncbi:MAG: DUF4845 domain-containing protein [Gammaproteobacteria bacterium]|nr:DUF4845 domain-containing protein [Gammaproteobacteria bacterium]
MLTINKQQGFSLWGVLILFALLAFFATIGLSLYPVYYEYFSVSSIMNRIQDEKFETKSQIVKRLSATMQIDNVRRLGLDAFDIKKTKTGFTVTLDYEDRVEMMGNVDAIAKFHKEIETSAR